MSGLRKTILKAVQKQPPTAESAGRPSASDRAKVLGLFLLECLNNRSITRDQFAEKLDIERELADALLDGLLPASEISNELLIDMAEVIGHPSNVLKIIMGRKLRPPAVSNSAS
jgi:hypothetical protein